VISSSLDQTVIGARYLLHPARSLALRQRRIARWEHEDVLEAAPRQKPAGHAAASAEQKNDPPAPAFEHHEDRTGGYDGGVREELAARALKSCSLG
jgi:hypothetical protein